MTTSAGANREVGFQRGAAHRGKSAPMPHAYHLEIATWDPLDDQAEIQLTRQEFPATPEGMASARRVCAEYNALRDPLYTYVAGVFCVVSDQTVMAILRRLVTAAAAYRLAPADPLAADVLDTTLHQAAHALHIRQRGAP